jgi:putative ABC transport system permease protein
MSRPPRLADRLLGATIRDSRWRDSIVGDLHEEFSDIRRRRGANRARRWYWQQAITIGGRVLMSRHKFAPQSERWMARADADERRGRGIGFVRDLQSAWRAVKRQPGTSAVIVVTLALALATNSTSFAILDAIVLRPFRFPAVDRVVMVVSSDPQQGLLDRESVTAGDYRDWRRETRTIAHLSAAEWWDANLSGIDQPEQIPARKVTAGFFEALGVSPVLGRTFTEAEEVVGNHRRVILGHALWTRLYAGDPSIVGRTVRLDGEPYDVVGIAPEGFAIPEGSQLWAPLALSAERQVDRRNRWFITVGRLNDGATLADARAEMGAIAERQRREYPDTNAGLPNAVVSFTRGMQDAGAGPMLRMTLAASVLLLLIACANVANLLLARGSDRAQEFALRCALGANRMRLTGQLLMEAAILATGAVLLAMPLAAAGLSVARASLPPALLRFIPGYSYIALSPTVFGVTALFGALATILFALMPALQTVGRDVADTLRQGSRTVTAPRHRQWLRNGLAAAQVAVTLALLFCAGLMLDARSRAVNGAMGFDRTNLLVARITLPERPYASTESRREFVTSVLNRMRTIPAVSHAAMVSNLPYAGGNTTRPFWPEGVTLRESEVRSVDFRRVTTNYFEAMRIPLLAGRELNDGDRADTMPVAVVSKTLADRYWPNGDALGRRFMTAPNTPPITIVGIAGDVLHDWFQQRRPPTVYRPIAQDAPYGFAFVIRTIGDPTSLAGDLRRAVAAADPDQPIMSMQSMEGLIEERTAGLMTIAGMVTVVGAIALVLAVMGLYSLMAYTTARRVPELGVRLALGATRWQIVSLLTRQGARITVAGLVAGAAGAFALGRLMESSLFGAVVVSVGQLLALIVGVAAVAMLASYLPARRSARLDPTVALRSE